jgi:hypothetical protein
MPTDEYLDEVYYIDSDDSCGLDSSLWDGQVTDSSNFTLKGYYLRIKKINDTL